MQLSQEAVQQMVGEVYMAGFGERLAAARLIRDLQAENANLHAAVEEQRLALVAIEAERDQERAELERLQAEFSSRPLSPTIPEGDAVPLIQA